MILQDTLLSCRRVPRPTICVYNRVERVGLANMMAWTDGSSNPSVKTPTFTITETLPFAKFARTSSLFSRGVVPTITSVVTDALLKDRAKFSAWLTPDANTMAF